MFSLYMLLYFYCPHLDKQRAERLKCELKVRALKIDLGNICAPHLLRQELVPCKAPSACPRISGIQAHGLREPGPPLWATVVTTAEVLEASGCLRAFQPHRPTVPQAEVRTPLSPPPRFH